MSCSLSSRAGTAAASGLNWISRLPGTAGSGETLACSFTGRPVALTMRSMLSAAVGVLPAAIAYSEAKRA